MRIRIDGFDQNLVRFTSWKKLILFVSKYEGCPSYWRRLQPSNNFFTFIYFLSRACPPGCRSSLGMRIRFHKTAWHHTECHDTLQKDEISGKAIGSGINTAVFPSPSIGRSRYRQYSERGTNEKMSIFSYEECWANGNLSIFLSLYEVLWTNLWGMFIPGRPSTT